ncbi:MAG: 50S ribosomal protein L18 [Candidatus Micrarchaeia archaeon]|jgi:large subunit ribosomal protein L18
MRIKEIPFRRRRLGLTNYKKRLALVKSGLERVVVRKTNKNIIGQVVAYDEKGDKVLASANSKELAKFNWPARSNRPTAYLTGLLLAKKYKGDKNKELVLDIGLSSPVRNSIPFVFAKGCIDGGMRVKANLEINEEYYNGSLIKEYASKLKGDEVKYKKQFGKYIEGSIDPENLPKLFAEVKEKIMKTQG